MNGILTGSGIEDAVVRYNDAEIIGLRLLTIPIEDLFYGFELFLLNVFFYQAFETKFKETGSLRERSTIINSKII